MSPSSTYLLQDPTGNCLAETDLVLNSMLPSLSGGGTFLTSYGSVCLIISPLGEYSLHLALTERRERKKRQRGAMQDPAYLWCTLLSAAHSTLPQRSDLPKSTLQQGCITPARSLGQARDETPQFPVDKLLILQFWQLIFRSVLFQENLCIFLCMFCGFTTTGSDSC